MCFPVVEIDWIYGHNIWNWPTLQIQCLKLIGSPNLTLKLTRSADQELYIDPLSSPSTEIDWLWNWPTLQTCSLMQKCSVESMSEIGLLLQTQQICGVRNGLILQTLCLKLTRSTDMALKLTSFGDSMLKLTKPALWYWSLCRFHAWNSPILQMGCLKLTNSADLVLELTGSAGQNPCNWSAFQTLRLKLTNFPAEIDKLCRSGASIIEPLPQIIIIKPNCHFNSWHTGCS